MSEQPTTVASALGRIPSGVFILVAQGENLQKTGMLASWVQQAGFEPPQVTVAVNKSRYLNDWLKEGSCVTLNQVMKGDSTLFRHFGKGFDPEADAFSGIDVTTGSNGLPVLPKALCSLLGKVAGRLESGDHVIYLVEVTDAVLHEGATSGEPFVHLRKNGLSY